MNVFDKYTEYTDFPCHYARLEWLFNTIKENRNSNETVNVLDVNI
jgi:hypothetical protein